MDEQNVLSVCGCKKGKKVPPAEPPAQPGS